MEFPVAPDEDGLLGDGGPSAQFPRKARLKPGRPAVFREAVQHGFGMFGGDGDVVGAPRERERGVGVETHGPRLVVSSGVDDGGLHLAEHRVHREHRLLRDEPLGDHVAPAGFGATAPRELPRVDRERPRLRPVSARRDEDVLVAREERRLPRLADLRLPASFPGAFEGDDGRPAGVDVVQAVSGGDEVGP